MADRITDVLLSGLRRAVREAGGLPLMASRKSPGLFPATAAGRQAAERACADNLLASRSGDTTTFVLTEAGRAYLAAELHPREVLDDIARAVEARGSQLARLIDAVGAMQSEWSDLRTLIGRVTESGPSPARPAGDEICERLEDWSAPGDCPLPELFRRLSQSRPDWTVGAFHDCLRLLHREGRIYLHPWTGPLYTLPEPALALLVGHEVAYYVSRRVTDFRLENGDRRLHRATA